jgi:hypothetical protein
MVLDLFFTLMKALSIMPDMPSATVIEVRGPMRSGRPTSSPLSRSKTRSSMGSTLYFAASVEEDGLQFLELRRVLRGQVVGQTEVGAVS